MNLENDLGALLGDSIHFGMDYGTSNSCVAYKEVGSAPKVIDYPGNYRAGVPSLAWVDKNGQEYYCDQVALYNAQLEDPNGVCQSAKMKLQQKTVVLNGRTFELHYLAMKMVQRVLEVSRKVLTEEMVDMHPDTWVAGVPARFDAAEHGELQKILQEATGKRVRLVAEPILAAITLDYFTKKQGRQPRRLLVLDIGGGTTDVVVLIPNEHPTAKQPEPYIALCPDGLREAGDDFDRIMEELILEEIRKNPGAANMAVLEDTSHFDRRRLLFIARETKERLSSVDSCPVSISGIDCGSVTVNITRARYEEKIRPVVRKIVDKAAEVLRKCDLGAEPDVDILLVGGSTYIPLVKTMVEEKFPWIPADHVLQRFPEKAVALGAAIYAEMPELVNPKVAYGYAVNTHINDGKKEVLRVTIPSGATLPATVTADFSTLDEGQKAVKFTVYEVPDTGKNTHMSLEVGRATTYSITHRFSTRVPRESPVRLTTTLSEDGVLTMKVEDFQPQKEVTEKTFTMTNTRSE